MTNSGDRLLLVFTEPEAQDFWLRPGESVEVRADIKSLEDNFQVTENSNGITFWPLDGMGYISVWANERELYCGHQRPDNWA